MHKITFVIESDVCRLHPGPLRYTLWHEIKGQLGEGDEINGVRIAQSVGDEVTESEAAMTYAEFLTRACNPEDRRQRPGQWAFNVLHSTRPDLSEQIRSGPLDPFYRNDRLPDFFQFVEENWGTAAQTRRQDALRRMVEAGEEAGLEY